MVNFTLFDPEKLIEVIEMKSKKIKQAAASMPAWRFIVINSVIALGLLMWGLDDLLIAW